MIGVAYAAFSRRWASNEDGGKGWARWSLGVSIVSFCTYYAGDLNLAKALCPVLGKHACCAPSRTVLGWALLPDPKYHSSNFNSSYARPHFLPVSQSHSKSALIDGFAIVANVLLLAILTHHFAEDAVPRLGHFALPARLEYTRARIQDGVL